MKRLVVMMTVVLAILIPVKAYNPSFSDLSHNHRHSLTHFPHSRPINYLSLPAS
jgi:hypothetical protein